MLYPYGKPFRAAQYNKHTRGIVAVTKATEHESGTDYIPKRYCGCEVNMASQYIMVAGFRGKSRQKAVRMRCRNEELS